VLYAPQYGSYRFTLRAPGDAALDLDGQTLLWLEDGGERTAHLELAQGNHPLRLRARAVTGRVSLSWQQPGGQVESVPQWALYAPPVMHHGLKGSYYANAAWEGTPDLIRIDPILDTYYHIPPLPRPYSAEWMGTLEAPQPGTYELGVRAVGWAQLWVDGQVVVETGEPGVNAVRAVSLSRGHHDLRLRFRDTSGHSRLHLQWQPPGAYELVAIPGQFLWPPRADHALSAPVGSALPDGLGAQERRQSDLERLALQDSLVFSSCPNVPAFPRVVQMQGARHEP
jgi:hypothetical protein